MIEVIKKHLETLSSDIEVFISENVWITYLKKYPPKIQKEALFLSLLHWKSNYFTQNNKHVGMDNKSCACCYYAKKTEKICPLSSRKLKYPTCGNAGSCCAGHWINAVIEIEHSGYKPRFHYRRLLIKYIENKYNEHLKRYCHKK